MRIGVLSLIGILMSISSIVALIGSAILAAYLFSESWFSTASVIIGVVGFGSFVYDSLWRKPIIDQSVLMPLKTRLRYDIDSNRRGEWFHQPYPSWPEYRDNCVVKRENVINELEDNFKKKSMLFLLGTSGSGKTTVSTYLGYQWLNSNRRVRNVYFVDALRTSEDNIVHQIVRLTDRKSIYWRYLVIVDNIHTNERILRRLFDNRESLTESNIFVLCISRSKQHSIGNERKRILMYVTDEREISNDGNLLPTLILEEGLFSDIVSAIFDAFTKHHNLEIILDQYQWIIRLLSERSSQSLWLLSFFLQSLIDRDEPISGTTIQSIDINEQVINFYNNILEIAGNDGTISSVVIQRMTNPQRLILYHRILAVFSIFNTLEIPVPISFVHGILETEQLDIHEQFVVQMLEKLITQGYLIGHDNDSCLTLPHNTAAKILDSVLHKEYNSFDFEKYKKGNIGQTKWLHEAAAISLLSYIDGLDDSSLLNYYIELLKGLGPYSDTREANEARIGCCRFILASNPDDDAILFKLGESYLFLHEEDDAKRAFKRAIALDPSYILNLGIMADDGALSDYDNEVCRIARKFYKTLQPWYDEVTDQSLSLPEFDEFDGIEIKGLCPVCQTEIYGEAGLPRPNMYSESISGSLGTDGCTLDCQGCGNSFEFDVHIDVAHVFFAFSGTNAPAQWNFKYRLLSWVNRP